MSFKKQQRLGLLLGVIAVMLFGMTMPMTRVAVQQMHPVFVGMGRALFAAMVSMGILYYQRAPWPTREQVRTLVLIGFCISISFPVLAAYAMMSLPASHGAIVIGLLPMGTSLCLSFMEHERPSINFWIASLVGGLTVVAYAVIKSGGALHIADIYLLLTVIMGSVGYAQGAVLAKTMGGMRVMCWALVCSLPILIVFGVPQVLQIHPSTISFKSWFAFIYLALISQLFGMGLWYKALSLGSAVKVSQVQLLQPFFTICFAVVFFQESVDRVTWLAASVVVLSIQWSRKSAVQFAVQK